MARGRSQPLRSLIRFHLASGTRVALRGAPVQVGGLAVLIGASPEPVHTLNMLALGVAGDPKGAGGMMPAFGAWGLVMVLLAHRRMAVAEQGWSRSLPIGSKTRRRAYSSALLLAQLPMLGTWMLLWIAGALLGAASLERLLLPCLVAVGAIWVALPVKGWGARLLGILAAGLALGASPLAWASPLLLVLADVLAGPMQAGGKEERKRAWAWPPRALPFVVGWRAVGRRLPAMYFWAALCLGALFLFLNNNVLTPAQEGIGIRAAGGLALALLLLPLATALRLLRPPFALARALPWAAQSRLLLDVQFLLLHTLPVLVAVGWWAEWELLSLIVLALYLSLRLAVALRGAGDKPTVLGAAVAVETFVAVLWVAVSSWAALVLLGLMPWVLRAGVRLEKRLKISLWRERHHELVGEPG